MQARTVSLEELMDLRRAGVEFPVQSPDEVICYATVRQSQLSLARFCGGLAINGKFFVYNEDDDSLIREDIAKWAAKMRKKEEVAAADVAKPGMEQMELFAAASSPK